MIDYTNKKVKKLTEKCLYRENAKTVLFALAGLATVAHGIKANDPFLIFVLVYVLFRAVESFLKASLLTDFICYLDSDDD